MLLKRPRSEKEALKKPPYVKEALKKAPPVKEALKKVPSVKEALKKVPSVKEALKKVPSVKEAPKKVPAVKEALFSLGRPLCDEDWQTYDQELSLLQGNILKNHGREAALYVFLTFNERKRNEAKKFIRGFADRVTSAKAQDEQIRRYSNRKNAPYEPELVAGFCLSAAGYRFLGLDLGGFSDEFRGGLKDAHKRLCDPLPTTWEDKFQQEVHALVFFAHDNVSKLVAELIRLREMMEGLASVTSEFGITMRNPEGDAIEHFGYADGGSQPIFFKADVPKQKHWDPAAGPNLVLKKDPHGTSDAECGTYVVFRKLEQNVRGFKEQEKSVAEKLNWKGEEEELVGAMLVGRFENGTPIVLSKHEAYSGNKNDFLYASEDAKGRKCPFFAHIRKVNPRAVEDRAYRIARRGITYGDPTPPGDDQETWPERGVGLLFHCCQADLAKQFEKIQRDVNNCDFPNPQTGQDPVIGQTRNFDISVPAGWNDAKGVACSFGGFVGMRGGEYFFAPSISVLKRL